MDSEKQDLDMPHNDPTHQPMVAVYMICYNCEAYIAQAIEGVLMQQTNFAVKLFIGDDASTDNTSAICKKYRAQYPEKIELILHANNVGAVQNAQSVYNACLASGAAYIAMCEGDDYWTDALKLQKQVDLLEANPQYALCFHEVNQLHESTKEQHEFFLYTKEFYNTKDVIELGTFIATPSIVFRSNAIQFPNWYFRISFGDTMLILMVSLKGDIVLIRERMAVYRKHEKGMSIEMEANQIQLALESVKLLHYFNLHTNFAHDATIQSVNTATILRFKHFEPYQNTMDTRSIPQKLASPDFWKRKAKEITTGLTNKNKK
jgi:glycosyltransferase involved in cell wall biosynthesis